MKSLDGFAVLLVMGSLLVLMGIAWQLYSMQEVITQLAVHRAARIHASYLIGKVLDQATERAVERYRTGISPCEAYERKEVSNSISYRFLLILKMAQRKDHYYLLLKVFDTIGECYRVSALLTIGEDDATLSHVTFGTAVWSRLYVADQFSPAPSS